MKITVLTYLEVEDDPAHDPVVDQVVEALRAGGHEATVVGVHGDLMKLIDGIRRSSPDLVYNLMEMFGEDVCGDVSVAGLLSLLGVPFTGAGPGELFLAQDKALAKKLLAFEGIHYPRFAVFSRDADLETGGNLRMPLFVKPLRLDASIGIDQTALVRDSISLMKRVLSIHEECNDAALAEEYIEGREFYVGILGNHEPLALPPIELDFSGLAKDKPHFLDSKAKWDPDSPEYQGTRSVIAQIPDELRARLQKVSLDAYRALKVRDYGRVDLRLTEAGEIYVIEVNASCYLEKNGEFATAAAAAGIAYPDLVNRIAALAAERYRAQTAPPRMAPTAEQAA